MLVDEELVARERGTSDAEIDAYTSSEGSTCSGCSDCECYSGCSCEESGDDCGKDKRSEEEVEEDYTETFKSLSLKGASISNTPAKNKATDNANIPEKEISSEKEHSKGQNVKKEKSISTKEEKSVPKIREVKKVCKSQDCSADKCSEGKATELSKVQCCKKNDCHVEKNHDSDDECCSPSKEIDAKKMQEPAPAGRLCSIM